jgi:excisionase family DNA binding protein
MAIEKRAYTVEEFCKAYNIGRTSFYGEVKDGRIQPRKLGKKTLVLREEAERWLRELPRATQRHDAPFGRKPKP